MHLEDPITQIGPLLQQTVHLADAGQDVHGLPGDLATGDGMAPTRRFDVISHDVAGIDLQQIADRGREDGRRSGETEQAAGLAVASANTRFDAVPDVRQADGHVDREYRIFVARDDFLERRLEAGMERSVRRLNHADPAAGTSIDTDADAINHCCTLRTPSRPDNHSARHCPDRGILPSMAGSSHVYQAPRGTRDFLPEDMAVRLHIEQAWRTAAVTHGFLEIEGPTFEHLELYTSKSGPGIVSELFSFKRSGGETEFALRPEFTPTLARMAAAQGRGLPVPTRWFSMPWHYRAERPQRGRLREFRQFNVDVIGDASPAADAETIAVALAALARLGLTADDVQVRISHRAVVNRMLNDLGVADDRITAAQDLLDKRDRIEPDAFAAKAAELGLDPDAVTRLAAMGGEAVPASTDPATLSEVWSVPAETLTELVELREELEARGLLEFCRWDISIVRGLAYYTGAVWEIHETSGNERAIAGGGRYDNLVESFGGPSLPACGFGMGDVVLELVLRDRSLIEQGADLLPRPDAFVLSMTDENDSAVVPMLSRLRAAGLHARTTGKSTRNLGKLLKDANKCRARHAVILGEEFADGSVTVKDLDSAEQSTVAVDELVDRLGGG